MRKLKIDWGDFEAAIASAGDEVSCYLDLTAGNVVSIFQETSTLLEELAGHASFEERLAGAPEADKDALREAWQVQEQCGARFVEIPEFAPDYHDLEAFIATVKDPAARAELDGAIRGAGAFRRFRRVIDHLFRERKQWFAFRAERQREAAAQWLATRNIEVDWVVALPATTVEPRRHLLEGVLRFVRSVSQIDGSRRIALLGSLTQDEPDPKDADLLLTVADAMDLAPLAKAGRKLAGHAQQLGRGADVFLANERGEYIGRACHWRECGPGIRASCDALHCGRREYLHDDFGAVRLEATLVAQPPVELWPVVVVRVTVPGDVEEVLLTPLRLKS